jgi:hypothetical protein
MTKEKALEQKFDELLFQISKGNTHDKIEKGSFFMEFEQVKEWKSKFGFSFSIYGNEHFIENSPHFHFDNNEKGIACKVGFDGIIFECKRNKSIPRNILKELKYFLKQIDTKELLNQLWNTKNPELVI